MAAFHPLPVVQTDPDRTTANDPLADIYPVHHKLWMKMATALLALLFALPVIATPALSRASEVSSPQDRQRVVTIVRSLERAPLDLSLRDDRAWALQWLIDAPDVTVNVCFESLGGISERTYAYSADIVVQYSLGMAAFVIENSPKASDADAQQLAGIESALKAYSAMRIAKPGKISPELEKLLALQSAGELPLFVQKAYLRCSKKH